MLKLSFPDFERMPSLTSLFITSEKTNVIFIIFMEGEFWFLLCLSGFSGYLQSKPANKLNKRC